MRLIGASCEAIDIPIRADVMGKILTGRRKVLSSGLVAVETYLGWTLMGKVPEEDPSYFSNYDRIIRLVAWMLRFKHNCKNVTGKKHGELTVTEFQEAETKVLLMIQTESFLSEEKRLKSLQTFKEDHSIIRLKTKIIYRKDSEDFLRPIVLPPK
ncbi:integrase catalytic domain-containing protein [Trichonephila clavipes]|nr:integrase catalytic domain-containing protein [Trichonephila clavipes]